MAGTPKRSSLGRLGGFGSAFASAFMRSRGLHFRAVVRNVGCAGTSRPAVYIQRAVSHPLPSEAPPSQVSLKTLFTVIGVVIGAWALVAFVERTVVALTFTVSALMIAV